MTMMALTFQLVMPGCLLSPGSCSDTSTNSTAPSRQKTTTFWQLKVPYPLSIACCKIRHAWNLKWHITLSDNTQYLWAELWYKRVLIGQRSSREAVCRINMTKKNVIAQDPIGDGVGARTLKVRFSLSRTGHEGNPFYQWDIFIATQDWNKLYASLSRAFYLLSFDTKHIMISQCMNEREQY